jgi:hypothetical protein
MKVICVNETYKDFKNKDNGVWLEKYIVVDYCILTIREIYGVKKEFTHCKNITIKLKEYEWRLKV